MSERSDRLYPLLFEPVLKDYIWGGRNLESLFGRTLPHGRVAESWEIAAHEDGASVVVNGSFAGLTLAAVHEQLGLKPIGRRNAWAQERGKFPLLVKLLDAQDKLSVQVHPDDSYALDHEGNELGKTEMWVILSAEAGAEIILGVREGTTPESFHAAINEGSLESYLHHVPVSAGDFVCVPSGTLHAILGGIVIAEIQQNSNTTYRVYDWNRTDGGKARPLHIDKAMDVINFNVVEPQKGSPVLVEDAEGIRRWRLCSNRYFTTERVEFAPGTRFTGDLIGESLEIWGVIKGRVELNGTHLEPIRFTLLPAEVGPFEVRAGELTVCLRSYVR